MTELATSLLDIPMSARRLADRRVACVYTLGSATRALVKLRQREVGYLLRGLRQAESPDNGIQALLTRLEQSRHADRGDREAWSRVRIGQEDLPFLNDFLAQQRLAAEQQGTPPPEVNTRLGSLLYATDLLMRQHIATAQGQE